MENLKRAIRQYINACNSLALQDNTVPWHRDWAGQGQILQKLYIRGNEILDAELSGAQLKTKVRDIRRLANVINFAANASRADNIVGNANCSRIVHGFLLVGAAGCLKHPLMLLNDTTPEFQETRGPEIANFFAQERVEYVLNCAHIDPRIRAARYPLPAGLTLQDVPVDSDLSKLPERSYLDKQSSVYVQRLEMHDAENWNEVSPSPALAVEHILDQGAEFLQHAWQRHVKQVMDGSDTPLQALCHCFGGINRSAFIAAYWLARFQGLQYEQAVELVRVNRNQIFKSEHAVMSTTYGWHSKAKEHLRSLGHFQGDSQVLSFVAQLQPHINKLFRAAYSCDVKSHPPFEPPTIPMQLPNFQNLPLFRPQPLIIKPSASPGEGLLRGTDQHNLMQQARAPDGSQQSKERQLAENSSATAPISRPFDRPSYEALPAGAGRASFAGIATSQDERKSAFQRASNTQAKAPDGSRQSKERQLAENSSATAPTSRPFDRPSYEALPAGAGKTSLSQTFDSLRSTVSLSSVAESSKNASSGILGQGVGKFKSASHSIGRKRSSVPENDMSARKILKASNMGQIRAESEQSLPRIELPLMYSTARSHMSRHGSSRRPIQDRQPSSIPRHARGPGSLPKHYGVKQSAR